MTSGWRLARYAKALVAASLFVSSALAPASADAFEVPRLTGAVVDQAGMLSAGARERLEVALRELHKAGGTQLVVLTVPSLAGLSIEQAAIQVADQWKLGDEAADNGVVLMLARDERRMRIEVGQGLEGVLSDAYASRIIREAITPLFKAGDVDGGVMIGVYQIASHTNPEFQIGAYLDAPRTRRSRGGRQPASPLSSLLVFLIFVPLTLLRLGLFGGNRRYRRNSAYFWGGAAAGSTFRGGGGGGFGGFSGGGGGFSGGGASGGW